MNKNVNIIKVKVDCAGEPTATLNGEEECCDGVEVNIDNTSSSGQSQQQAGGDDTASSGQEQNQQQAGGDDSASSEGGFSPGGGNSGNNGNNGDDDDDDDDNDDKTTLVENSEDLDTEVEVSDVEEDAIEVEAVVIDDDVPALPPAPDEIVDNSEETAPRSPKKHKSKAGSILKTALTSAFA